MDRVAIGRDRSELDGALVVLELRGLSHAARPTLHRLAVCLGRVGNGQRDVADAVAVARVVTGDLVVLAKRRRQDEADLALLEHVGGPVAEPGLGPCVGRAREAEDALVEVRRLLCVPDPELEVVPTEQRHEVLHGTSV